MQLTATILALSSLALGAIAPSMSIPRDASRRYLSDGIFDGGKAVRANIEGLRFSKHKREKFERWVFDFSDATTQTIGSVAPQFRIRYVKAGKMAKPEGGHVTLEPAKIIISLKGVSKNLLTRPMLEKLAQKSNLVKEVISYPPIEDGDLAIEMILKDSYPFYSHQPLTHEGRLVIDISENS